MIRTFNLGAGLLMVAAASAAKGFVAHLAEHGCQAYPVGKVVPGTGDVLLRGKLNW